MSMALTERRPLRSQDLAGAGKGSMESFFAGWRLVTTYAYIVVRKER